MTPSDDGVTVDDVAAAIRAGSRTRSDKVQLGNPHGLVRDQHVYPRKSIDRFLNAALGVELADLRRGRVRPAKSDDKMFCADRAWSDGAERGWMKRIEDEFQALAQLVLLNPAVSLEPAEEKAARKFYALWHARAERRHLPVQYVRPNGVLPPETPQTADEIEILEKNGYAATRPDGSIAFRDLNTANISIRVGRLEKEIMHEPWGVVVAEGGEFCVPDTPVHGIIPVSPTVALGRNVRSGRVTRENVAEINRAMLHQVTDYVFARCLAACPGLPRTIHR